MWCRYAASCCFDAAFGRILLVVVEQAAKAVTYLEEKAILARCPGVKISVSRLGLPG